MTKTRFAPSPTGTLHLGGARTALFSWLYAKHHQGQFVLRIEDTDLERSTQASVDGILDSMRWLQLDWDEGPFYQSQRREAYVATVAQLVQAGKAYRCTCTRERLDALRQRQTEQGLKPRYDGHCRQLNLPATALPHVVRLASPQTGHTVFQDKVHGPIEFANSELDDLILLRSDGSPTYQLTVVVDDMTMGITDVIRGDDHINNTPRQIHIYEAMGASIPSFAHIPMVLGPDGKRLSKRHGAVSVGQFQASGIVADALLNYLVRLGWAAGDQEIFSRAQMIEQFDLSAVNKAACAVDYKKLQWLNLHYLKTQPLSDTVAQLGPFLAPHNVDLAAGPALEQVVPLLVERSKTLQEMAQAALVFYEEQPAIAPDLVKKHLTTEKIHLLTELADSLESVADWQPTTIKACLQALVTRHDLKIGKVAQPLRVAVTGQAGGANLDDTLALIGQQQTIGRLRATLAALAS